MAEALRARGRKTLPLKEVLAWRLPVKPDGCAKLLELQEGARAELGQARMKVASLENELNDLVYEIYGVTGEERKVIEGFLDRFSSAPGASALGAGPLEEPEGGVEE